MKHGTFTLRLPMQNRHAWNAGKMVVTKRPRMQKQRWAIRFFFDGEGQFRDRALFNLAFDCKLCWRELAKTRIGDLVSCAEIRTRSIVIQQKIGRPVQFELTADDCANHGCMAETARRHGQR